MSKKEIIYYSEAHRKNSEGAKAYIAKNKKQPMPLEVARKQQKKNSQD